MLKLSSVVVSLLVLAVGVLTASAWAGESWPLKRDIDLSSGFGDFRDNHFHGGVDLRTGGKIGAEVISPVDGYVWRVYVSYSGYGKGLYIMGDDGYLYVFGHLSRLTGKIGNGIKTKQLADRRYFQDVYFPADSVRVEKGELLAYTGQSGKGGPHLHFEKRTADNVPINPLSHGFDIADKIKPTFSRIGIQLTDDRSLLDNGRRKMFLDLKPAGRSGNYRSDTLIYMHRPFGFLIDGYDRMRSGGMKQSIYRLRLYIDDHLLYETRLDSLSFETTDAVRLEYDYVEAADNRKRVRHLFRLVGNRFTGSSSGEGSGIYGVSGREKVGRHRARIVGEDCFGNRSEVRFDFLWGPPDDIFTLDSVVTPADNTTDFHFTPVAGYEALGVDSIAVLRNGPGVWGKPSEVTVFPLENARLKCRVKAQRTESALLRLFLFAGDAVIRDNIFNGLKERQPDRCKVVWEVVEDGLLVTLNIRNKMASQSRIELYHGDSLLGVEYPQYFDLTRHICFIPPRPEYSQIDRIGMAMTRDPSHQIREFSDSLDIHLIGYRDNQVIAVDDQLTLTFNRANLYQPRFIEVRRNIPRFKTNMHLNSAHYEILPEAFVTREDFWISLKIPSRTINQNPSGICWLDKKENRWVWLDNEVEDDGLRATSLGGGSFAAVFDYNPPRITRLSLSEGRTYTTRKPRITFLAEDTLSGIGDDRNIVVKIDAQWQIVDYDPETNRCVTQPVTPLEPGPHHLAILVTDRAGNLTEQYYNFVIKESRKRGH